MEDTEQRRTVEGEEQLFILLPSSGGVKTKDFTVTPGLPFLYGEDGLLQHLKSFESCCETTDSSWLQSMNSHNRKLDRNP